MVHVLRDGVITVSVTAQEADKHYGDTDDDDDDDEDS